MAVSDFDKQIPYSAEAEQSVLGAILLDPAKIDAAVLVIKPSGFYIKKHREIYEAMVELHDLQIPIDGVTLIEKLRENGTFGGDEDRQYILSLTESTSMIADINHYLKIIADKAALRDMLGVCEEISGLCYEGQDVAKVVEVAEQKIYDITNNRNNTELYKFHDIVLSELREWSEMQSDTTGKYAPMFSGISSLDNSLGGFGKSDLVIVAARPGVGKTALALNIAYNIAKSSEYEPRKSVVIFSLEMSKEQLARRILSFALRIDNSVLRTGNLSLEQWQDTYRFVKDELINMPMYFDDTPNITVAEMKAKIRRVKNLGFIVVDYLQLMNSSRKIDSRVQEISEITRSFKIMAKEFNVPLLLLSQMSRSIEQRKDDKTPRLSDLRDSGSVEQDADSVLFLNRPEADKEGGAPPNCCDLIIGKNRHGQAGQTIRLHWDGRFTLFSAMGSVPSDA